MDKNVAAMVLSEIGTLLDMLGENPFKARAFATAARALDTFEGDLESLAASGELEAMRGFGPVTADVVRELAQTGKSRFHADLLERTPEGWFELLLVPGLGGKRIHTLHEELGIDSLEDLREAAEAGRIAPLKGFGARTQAKLLEGISFVQGATGRRRQPAAFDAAARIAGVLENHASANRVKLSGELRRRMETVEGVDLIVETRSPKTVLRDFAALPGLLRAEVVDDRNARARLADGLEVRVRCATPASFVTQWTCTTGSAAHWRILQGMAGRARARLEADGLFRNGKRLTLHEEEDLYAAINLEWVPPELREAMGEIDAARSDSIPRLVTYQELRGTFHCHTTYSDGTASVAEMAEAALARGWRYLGIADHSQAAHYAGGLSATRLRQQHAEIDRWNAERGGDLWLFKGVEADILPDGRLDLADDGDGVLDEMDYVVGSIHGARGQSAEQITARALRAIEDPHLTFLGHPTGRLLLSRNAYAIDIARVVDAAVERGVAIEINADPARLDMDWRHWVAARGRGLLTGINPDAHSPRGLGNVEYGVGMARKGWLTAESVVNAWPLERVREWLESRKP